MCGILGYLDREGVSTKVEKFQLSLDKLSHRGPDGQGIWKAETVLLGHRRLSIIDLSETGAQPFISHHKKACIVFNGEIYNYHEISDGLDLISKSDTEVLLEGYLKHGIPFFKKIRGIYAFAIYDFRQAGEEKLVMLRDPAGVKPLYIFRDSEVVIFSSEIKSILPLLSTKASINSDAVKTYIHLGYFAEPDTVYHGITAVTPGEILICHANTHAWKKEKNIVYDFTPASPQEAGDVLKNTETLLRQAVRRNLVADVPVNIALSGGIDSSLVYAYANEVKPTLGLTVQMSEKSFDETDTATIYATHINAPHQIVSTEVEQKLALLNKLLLHFDQPYADSSFIPFYILSKSAARYSKVLIGGDSGDEIHNGYSGYKFLPLLLTIRSSIFRKPVILLLTVAKTVLKKFYRQLTKLQNVLSAPTNSAAMFEWHAWFPLSSKSYVSWPFKQDKSDLYKIFESDQTGMDVNSQVSENYFKKRMISDYLRKSDMMSMLNSLEFRVPMLDEDLVQASLKIPFQLKSDLFKGQKLILRKLHRNIYPADTSKLKKHGFMIPLDTWLGERNLQEIRNYLIREDGIVNQYIELSYIDILMRTLVEKTLQKYCSRESAYQRILILYALQLWYFKTYQESV